MGTIFHIAFARDWAAARRTGAYAVSTRGRTLAQEGFIHCSRADQWPATRAAFYGDVDLATDPLVLLRIDTTRLDVPVVDEPPAPGSAETFPHVYGPIPVNAVVEVIPLADGAGSFSRLYFREVFVNVALLCLVLAAGTAGIALGALAGHASGPGLGGLAGVATGSAVAVLLYRRRHRPAE
ncbi:DUF952 domain-containing protein [Nocardioides sp. SYSU DS0651]|uniref:DUF952 domain-containing protein n=1 Tax=Nocardioides sp. SYSU DS0651 TaxID=3415955 RepID=UPI003F4B4930